MGGDGGGNADRCDGTQAKDELLAVDVQKTLTTGLSGQGIGSWLTCHECEPSTTKDPPCKGAMHVKSRTQTSSCWCGMVVRRGDASSGVVLVT
ncbi:hypothetical protein TNCV_3277061 [Trichonephila clavipes]|nr:hypothetical protein TNCV_3277061 [Trichonephila clavipes]